MGSRSTESVEIIRRVWMLIGGGYLFSVVAILAYPEFKSPGRSRSEGASSPAAD